MTAPASPAAAPARDAVPARGPRHTGLLLTFALVKLAIHLPVLGRYGWFRDELYYMASTSHLDWGYVDHPPFSIAVLGLVRALFGESLIAARLVAALAGAATVVVTGLLARELGGGRFAQALACLAAIAAPVFLGTGRFYSMNAFDLLLWTAAALLIGRIVREGRPHHWVALGLVLGVGLLNKISMIWLAGALVLALNLSPHRRWFLTPWPWLAGLIAALLFVPHLLWQQANGWPTLEFMRNATANKMADVGWNDFVWRQILQMTPGTLPVWLGGLLFALFARDGRWRVLAWIYLSVAALLLLGGRSRASYLAVAYPMLLALGGVAWERWTAIPRGRALRFALPALVVVSGLVTLPFALPVLPVETFVRYQRALGMAPATEERLAVGPLPQHYADMFGWEELTALVARAYERLTPEERRRARVFGQNYGEAGAIDVLGKRYGLPAAISGHNSYWLWGGGDWDGGVLIIIGGDREGNAEFFEEIEIVAQTASPYAMPYERGLDVSIGRRMKMAPREAWPLLRRYI